MAHGRHP
ncbi:hypothetical protein YPPY32_5078, partial [Yersinia pestis PY-32]